MRHAFLLLVLFAALGGCGLKDDLYLPEKKAAAPEPATPAAPPAREEDTRRKDEAASTAPR